LADGGCESTVGFPIPALRRHSRVLARSWLSGGRFPAVREEAKQGGFRGDFAG